MLKVYLLTSPVFAFQSKFGACRSVPLSESCTCNIDILAAAGNIHILRKVLDLSNSSGLNDDVAFR